MADAAIALFSIVSLFGEGIYERARSVTDRSSSPPPSSSGLRWPTTPTSRRGRRAYGILNTVYGAAWFAGSVALGWIDGISLSLILAIEVVMQVLALLAFVSAKQRMEGAGVAG